MSDSKSIIEQWLRAQSVYHFEFRVVLIALWISLSLFIISVVHYGGPRKLPRTLSAIFLRIFIPVITAYVVELLWPKLTVWLYNFFVRVISSAELTLDTFNRRMDFLYYTSGATDDFIKSAIILFYSYTTLYLIFIGFFIFLNHFLTNKITFNSRTFDLSIFFATLAVNFAEKIYIEQENFTVRSPSIVALLFLCAFQFLLLRREPFSINSDFLTGLLDPLSDRMRSLIQHVKTTFTITPNTHSSEPISEFQLPAVVPNVLPTQNISPTTTLKSMQLLLRRTQRSGLMGKIIFALDARIGLNAEEQSLVRKFDLGNHVIYESSSREEHAEAAQAHLDKTRDDTSLFGSPASQFFGLGKTLYRLGRASVSATMSALSLRITIDSLIKGVHIECKSMGELLEAESAIVEASRNLKTFLENAITFDGREEILDL